MTQQQDTILKIFLYTSLVCILSMVLILFDQLIKATENVAWIQKRTLFAKVLMVIVLFATIWMHLSIELYYFLTCMAALSIVPMSISKINKEVPFIRFYPKWDKQAFKEMLPYCLNIFSFSLFQFSFITCVLFSRNTRYYRVCCRL